MTKNRSDLLSQLQVWGYYEMPKLDTPEPVIEEQKTEKVVLKPRTQDAKNFLLNLEEICEMMRSGEKRKRICEIFNIDRTRFANLLQIYLKKRS